MIAIGPGIIISMVTGYVYKVKLQRVGFNTNHDRLKPCGDMKISAWLETCRDQFKKGVDVLTGNKIKPTTPQCCVCRGLDTGKTMVQCDNCREWFHLTCIGMSIQETNEIDPYFCPNCQLFYPTPPSKNKGGEKTSRLPHSVNSRFNYCVLDT